MTPNFITSTSRFVAALMLGCLFLLRPMSVYADIDNNPLQPINTSSPRALVQGFLEFTNKSYSQGRGLITTYIDSSALYLTAEEMANFKQVRRFQAAAERALDLSEIPPAIADETSRRIMVQLKEVLDRIELPPMNSIPDAQAMAKSEFKYWLIPNTEIRIQRVEKGARAGEYLFSSDTVKRVPEFYHKVKNLPYKTNASVGWYNFTTYSPTGVALALNNLLPPRWLLNSPENQPASSTFLDQPAWRWLCIAIILGACFMFVRVCFRLSRSWRSRSDSAEQWADILRPLSLVIAMPIAALLLGEVLRISGGVYMVLMLSLWTLYYLALTWMTWLIGGVAASSLIAKENLLTSSIDSQLIRLVFRLITFIAVIAILVLGADRVGLPAYSVIAGLGVGGLAVALAAQQTLANLIGSLIIMIEKPFSVGDTIKVREAEGEVESVGFRSTRIRTSHNSLVTIPSSQIVDSTVDKISVRHYQKIRFDLGLVCDTPLEKIKAFVEGIEQQLASHPKTQKDDIHVFFYRFGAHSRDILVEFFLKVPDRIEELREQQQIFLDILHLAETIGIKFAFPTQTIHIANAQSLPGSVQQNAENP